MPTRLAGGSARLHSEEVGSSKRAFMTRPATERLVPPAIGDLGAYGFSESMPLFLSHPAPAEIEVRQGQVLANGHRAAYAGDA